ncbi:MAG: IS3 family transposase [Candidatus Binatia bacterium]
MTPSAKRDAVEWLTTDREIAERRACDLTSTARSTVRYRPGPRHDDAALAASMREIAYRYPRYGCPRVTFELRREGYKDNHKRIHRIWKAEGLSLKRKRPKRRRYGPRGEVMRKAEYKDHVWSYDFIEDRTEYGDKVRILNVLDEYTREWLAVRIERNLPATRVIEVLEWLMLTRGVPAYIRSDNGPEFIAKAVQDWLKKAGVQTIFITPGSPWENPYIESFHDKLRGECLNLNLFRGLRDAQQIIPDWRDYYNRRRPHSSLGYKTPEEFGRGAARPLRATPSAPLQPKDKEVILSL